VEEGEMPQDTEAAQPEEELRDPGLATVTIPSGAFLMGADPDDKDAIRDERPRRRVVISRPFRMMIYPVTQELYEKVVGKNPSHFRGDGRLPVDMVYWIDAVAFCNALSEKLGLTAAYVIEAGEVTWDRTANGYRLPTEAEWEYACRAGTVGARYGDIDDVAWYSKNSGGKSHVVGQKAPNAWGLHDLLGNVWEWCWDWYDENSYSTDPENDPQGPPSGMYHVMRGGGWSAFASFVRASNRHCGALGFRDRRLGFRCVRG
jgi:formylglycine-generating enzyme required for sulfatase activity